MTLRSLLFVPGDRPDRFAKAAASGADAVIVDLEDAVRPDRRPQAREAVARWLADGRAFVRCNPPGSPDLPRDLDACAGLPGLLGVVVPKCESPDDLDGVLDRVGAATPLVPLVESARGLLAAAAVAAHPAVHRLAFGNLDFAADCDVRVTAPDEPELLPARMQLTVAARAAGLVGPVDGVTADVRDLARAAGDAARAVGLGFSGKLCVHPAQVAVVHAAFAPSADQLAWASRVLDAAEGGVAVVDGQMVDRPVVLRARQILDRAPEDRRSP